MPTAPLDWNAEEDGEWQPDPKLMGQLCIAKDDAGAPQPRVVKAIDKAVADAQAAAKKKKPHCAATAALKGAAEFILPSLDGKSENCGPLTRGLEAALAHSDAAWTLINANRTVDTLDVALAFANGFGAADVEATGPRLVSGKLPWDPSTGASSSTSADMHARTRAWEGGPTDLEGRLAFGATAGIETPGEE